MDLTIHRGAAQIGGSCVEVRAQSGHRVLLDFGMPLARPDGSDWPRRTMQRRRDELRAEGVLPDIDGLYADGPPLFSALVLSHAHLDHYGLAHHIHPDIPVFASRGTIRVLEASRLFIPDAEIPRNIHELPSTGAQEIGPFLVRGIPVDHAAPDSRALLVEADGQRLLYSGDLRAHGRHRHLFDSLAEKAGPVDVLVLEGTTVGKAAGEHGFPGEADVEERLGRLLKSDPRFVAVIASGQNVDRAVSVYRAARASGRELVMDAYQAYVMITLKDVCPDAPQVYLPGVRVKFVRSHVDRRKEAGLWDRACEMSRQGKVRAEALAAAPERFVYLARGSGATEALLRYLIKTAPLTVVWSQWKGYWKRGGPVVRFCEGRGIEPIFLHSGGHAHPEDLADLVRRMKPRAVIPIHTESAGLFSSFMPGVRVMRDGEAVSVESLLSGDA